MQESIQIIPYAPALARRWDEFVRSSRNATFLVERAYMDYHSDRFADRSLLALRGDKILAQLPACLMGESGVSSHAGLTYGGWMLPPSHISAVSLMEIFESWLSFERGRGTTEIEYKPLPYIFAAAPSQEDLYALWRTGFRLERRLLSSTVDLQRPWKFSMSKRQQVRAAAKLPLTLAESSDWAGFWPLLEECLDERHSAAPVHTLPEMQLLASRFPKNIRLFTATDTENRIHAGVVIYDTGAVAHSQYAATSEWGRANYCLTALYHYLMSEVFASRRYFDFGTSNEQRGRVLNPGLLTQKFALGGTGVAYDCYSLELK